MTPDTAAFMLALQLQYSLNNYVNTTVHISQTILSTNLITNTGKFQR